MSNRTPLHIVIHGPDATYPKTLCGKKIDRGTRRSSRHRFTAALEHDAPHCDACTQAQLDNAKNDQQ
jgi:hypothetical protein